LVLALPGLRCEAGLAEIENPNEAKYFAFLLLVLLVFVSSVCFNAEPKDKLPPETQGCQEISSDGALDSAVCLGALNMLVNLVDHFFRE